MGRIKEMWPIEALMTIASNIVYTNNLAEVYPLLEYLTGHECSLVDYERLVNAVKPSLFLEYPWLADVEKFQVQNYLEVVAAFKRQHGESFSVTPIPSGSIIELTMHEALGFSYPEFEGEVISGGG